MIVGAAFALVALLALVLWLDRRPGGGRWLKRVRHHECRTPSSRRTGVGTLWKCRCGAVWRCVSNSYDPDGFRRVRWERQ